MTNFEALLNSDYEEYSMTHTIQESMNEANVAEQELIEEEQARFEELRVE